jgi:phosphate-selective porin OprO/OprP
LALSPGAARAQDDLSVKTAPSAASTPQDPREARIAALETEIRDLAVQVADLKASGSNGLRAARADQAAQPKVSLANLRPQIATADGDFEFALRSVVQFDAAHYHVSPLRADNDLSSGANFRRARLGFDATAFRDWNVALWGEFGGSGGESPTLNQAYLEYAGLRPFGRNVDLRLRVGAWAMPAGLEDATSNTESVFLERGAIAELVRGLDAGEGRTGAGLFLNGKRWYASGVLTGKVVGVPTTPEYGQQEGFVTRVALNPLHGRDYDLHLGGNVQGVIKPADTAAGAGVAEAVRLRERPELRVDGTRLVDAGNIAADGLTIYGLEGGASFRNFYAAGEGYRIDVSRTAVGASPSPFDPSFSGWYVQGAWTLTGEHRTWSGASGGFRGVRPAKPLDPKAGTWGAWEVGARYSVLDLNDHAGVAGSAAPFGGVRGGEQKITTVGLNWYPNSVVRFLLDCQWARIERLNATGGDIGEHVDTVSFRSQFAF